MRGYRMLFTKTVETYPEDEKLNIISGTITSPSLQDDKPRSRKLFPDKDFSKSYSVSILYSIALKLGPNTCRTLLANSEAGASTVPMPDTQLS